MTTYYRNEYLFSEIYLQEITQQPEDTEILASLTTLKEYREFARTATIQEWKDSFVHEVLYALRFNIKIENERLTLLYPVGNMETPLTLCYVLLPTEDLDNTTMGRNWAEKVIRSLRHHNLKWGLLTNGEQWRMYHLDESTPYEIFLEINLATILSGGASQAYQIFHKFMKVENFTTGEQGQGRLDVFKKESLAKIDYIESELANALKQKEEGGKGVLSNLCMGYVDFLKTGGSPNFDDEALRRKIYHGAMLYMFRLLFLFYADARGLLNETNSKLLNDVLRRCNASSANSKSASGYGIWEDLERIFVDIDQSYNGGLFDPHESEFTQFIEESRVNDAYLASALHYLTSYQERSREEKAISYRDMSVRHLGTLYEGLLEHKLFITKEDTEVRAVKDKIQFIPASQGGRIVAGRYIPAEQVYFGSDRGERKATGSYYTPEYIVDYIVRNTVGEKLAQLRRDFLAGQKDLLSAVAKAIDQKERKALTDLLEDDLKTFIKENILKVSVLDPAMGSGHFLVNTSNYIANFITEILNECEIIGTTETSTTHWRRWVVENCVYGVDVNPLAVELAKLSLWILSMSKEKPLSFLNHNLKTGNSLIGARLDDIGKYPGKGDKKQHSVFSDDRDFKKAVGKAISNYGRITSTDSASLDVIADKKAWLDEIDEILKPYKLVCDMHTSVCFGNDISEWEYKELIDNKDAGFPNNATLSYFHWDLEFAELLIERHGFDCIVGNPPYVAVNSIRDYPSIRLTQETRNLFAFFAEQANNVLLGEGYLSFIVPLSGFSVPQMKPFQNILLESAQTLHCANFCWRPAKVFDDANLPVTVFIMQKKGEIHQSPQIFTTNYLRWRKNEISVPTRLINYVDATKYMDLSPGYFPKIGQDIEISILEKLIINKPLKQFLATGRKKTEYLIYYRSKGGLYYKIFTDFYSGSTNEISISCISHDYKDLLLAALSSNIFFWYYDCFSSCRVLNFDNISCFPLSLDAISNEIGIELKKQCKLLMADLKVNAEMKIRNYSNFGAVETLTFYARKSKHIMNKIDVLLGNHYGLNNIEIKYLSNYAADFRSDDAEDE